MATEAQINANRENAKHSTGPVTPEGRATVAQNAVHHGLFAKRDFVRPEEVDLYNALATDLHRELKPGTLLENIHFAEALSATWRLHRCAQLEAGLDPLDPAHQKLQQSIDRARTQSHNLLMKATKEIARLRKQRPQSGVLELLAEKTEQTQSAPPPRPAISEQTQSVPRNTPRNAPCPCNSGQKYKRCCGFNQQGGLAQAA